MHQVIGLMSGTSLDGLDIAHCTFEQKNEQWIFQINRAETVAYPEEWLHRLPDLMQVTALELALADADLGHWMGKQVKSFLQKHELKADFISSHGHTVFHQPEKKLTLQIGKGAAIAAETGIPVVSDFRVLDVALGGQGAPLVPIGDELLFPAYDVCLNLGGISNLSANAGGSRIAFDVGPCNQVLNLLAQQLGMPYDSEGKLAESGTLLPELLSNWNQLNYYQQDFPKSLGKEWVDEVFLPLLPNEKMEDLLHTACVHFAFQIAEAIQRVHPQKTKLTLLATGGGVYNTFLMDCCKNALPQAEWAVLDLELTSFKEALVFAFLGVLRWEKQINCLKSVTGAKADSVGGSIFWV